MYERETKNINKLLEHVKVPGIISWRVSDLRDMEWEGEIRLTLHVVIDNNFYEKKYIREWNTNFDSSQYEWNTKQRIIKVFKHYVNSFLGLKIGDVKTVNLISYKIVDPTMYYSTYNHYNNNDYNNLYDTYDEYDWFG